MLRTLVALLAGLLLLGCGDDPPPADVPTGSTTDLPGSATASHDPGSAPSAGPSGEDSSTEAPEPSNGGDFRMALSVSPFTDSALVAGVTWVDGEREASDLRSLQALFAARGGTEVYARLSTRRASTPHGIDRSLARALDRAAVAVELELPLAPELGLFGSYGDVACQTPPDFGDMPAIELAAAWHELTLEEMEDALEAYGAIVAEALLATGATVEVWDIGNEVDFGTAGVAPQPVPGACDGDAGGPDWYRAPDAVNPAIGAESVTGLMQQDEAARIAWLQEHLWPSTARLLAATARGVRQVDPDARFATNLAQYRSPAFAVAFVESMAAGGFEMAELGLSFYPSAPDGLADRLGALQETVGAVTEAHGLAVFLAEVAYPAAAVTEGPFVDWNDAMADHPLTDNGQAALLVELVRWGRANGLAGLRPWAPDLVHPVWAPLALFAEADPTGRAHARPALAALQEALNGDP